MGQACPLNGEEGWQLHVQMGRLVQRGPVRQGSRGVEQIMGGQHEGGEGVVLLMIVLVMSTQTSRLTASAAALVGCLPLYPTSSTVGNIALHYSLICMMRSNMQSLAGALLRHTNMLMVCLCIQRPASTVLACGRIHTGHARAGHRQKHGPQVENVPGICYKTHGGHPWLHERRHGNTHKGAIHAIAEPGCRY